MARGFAPPRKVGPSGDPRAALDQNFRALDAYINSTFNSQPEYRPFFLPVRARGTLPLDVVLTRAFRYIETYLKGFAATANVLSGGWDGMIWDVDVWDGGPVHRFDHHPTFTAGEHLASDVAGNWKRLVEYLNKIAFRL